MTMIFEYNVLLSDGMSRRDYARLWQLLSGLPEQSVAPSLHSWLVPLLATAKLSRVRTNEQIFGPRHDLTWELRQFEPINVGSDEARLVQTRVPHTPPLAFNATLDLEKHIAQERAFLIDGDNRWPDALTAEAAILPSSDFSWRAPGADPLLAQAFNRNTCNGCHGSLARSPLGFQHIGPGNVQDVTRAPAQLSRFLSDPHSSHDELRRRAAKLKQALCEPCSYGNDAGAPDAKAGTTDAQGGVYERPRCQD